MKVYVVTQGKYSDYHIVGVFTDKLKAQALCDFSMSFHHWNNAEIEIYESDTIDVKDRKLFFVRMQLDGKVLEVHEGDSLLEIDDNNVYRDFDGNLYTNCLAKDEKHAIKIMSERKLKYKVENNI